MLEREKNSIWWLSMKTRGVYVAIEREKKSEAYVFFHKTKFFIDLTGLFHPKRFYNSLM